VEEGGEGVQMGEGERSKICEEALAREGGRERNKYRSGGGR